MKKLYHKSPVVYGILLGEGLSIFFILFEVFLVAAVILHAVWDIVIRIPRNFCEDISEGAVSNFIYILQDVLELGVFPIVAIVICILYKNRYDVRIRC